MLLMFFAFNFGFTNLENTFFQLLADKNWIFHLTSTTGAWQKNARDVGAIILMMVGVVSVIMQGRVVGLLKPRFGEVNLLRFAYMGMVPCLVLTPFLPIWIPMILGVIVMGTCMGLAQPSLNGLISRSAPADLQGGVFGVTQSLGALARFLGPIVSNFLFVQAPYYPYVFGAIIVIVPATMAWTLRQPAPDIQGQPAAVEA
jgi:hypothetical protein